MRPNDERRERCDYPVLANLVLLCRRHHRLVHEGAERHRE